MPVEAWRRLRGAIVDTVAEADCLPISRWTQVDSTSKGGDDQLYPLAMPRTTNTVMDEGPIHHQNNIPIRHLPGQDPFLQHFQGSLIASHIGEVTVELLHDHEKRARINDQPDNKGVPEFLRTNLTYLMRFSQVFKKKSLPEVLWGLYDSPKSKQIITLQCTFENN